MVVLVGKTCEQSTLCQFFAIILFGTISTLPFQLLVLVQLIVFLCFWCSVSNIVFFLLELMISSYPINAAQGMEAFLLLIRSPDLLLFMTC